MFATQTTFQIVKQNTKIIYVRIEKKIQHERQITLLNGMQKGMGMARIDVFRSR